MYKKTTILLLISSLACTMSQANRSFIAKQVGSIRDVGLSATPTYFLVIAGVIMVWSLTIEKHMEEKSMVFSVFSIEWVQFAVAVMQSRI